MDRPRKVYLLTEEQMQKLTEMICMVSATVRLPHQQRRLSEANNLLAHLPSVSERAIQSSDIKAAQREF